MFRTGALTNGVISGTTSYSSFASALLTDARSWLGNVGTYS